MLFKLPFLSRASNGPAPEPVAFPPPYRRMIAINSDVEMTSWPMQMHLFGEFTGRDLETAFSYWFFGDPAVTWHVFNRDLSLTPFGPAALGLARAGLLDTIHSFTGVRNGRGYQFDRDMIRQGYAQLKANGVTCRIYTNHGTTDDTQNIGGEWVSRPGYPSYGQGDLPGAQRYHVDLTVGHGVRFFWLDIDNAQASLSFTATAGEAYDNLFVSQICRDGTPILRFRRTDAMVRSDLAQLGDALDRVLAADDGGYTVLYTHLGVKRDPENRPLSADPADIPSAVLAGLDRLSAEQKAGRVLVTTTERLLGYALMSAARPWAISRRGRQVEVEFSGSFSFAEVAFEYGWQEFMGFSLPVDASDVVSLRLNGQRRPAERWNVAGQSYAGLQWRRLPMKSAIEEARRVSGS
jgi:hypothetical protein